MPLPEALSLSTLLLGTAVLFASCGGAESQQPERGDVRISQQAIDSLCVRIDAKAAVALGGPLAFPERIKDPQASPKNPRVVCDFSSGSTVSFRLIVEVYNENDLDFLDSVVDLCASGAGIQGKASELGDHAFAGVDPKEGSPSACVRRGNVVVAVLSSRKGELALVEPVLESAFAAVR